jgi:GPH family glycoside/pentoside/hexuronide:cation symporter
MIRKIGYGSARTGIAAVEIQLELFLLIYYNVVVGLSPFYTGLALAIVAVWDGINDPLMGVFTDRTRNALGRRRPYFVPGAVGLAIGTILLFHPPALESDVSKFLYLLLTYSFLETVMTVLIVPHDALGGDLSFDRNERTTIVSVSFILNTVGILLGMMLPTLMLKQLGGGGEPEAIAQTRRLTAVLLALPIVGTALWSFLATRGRDVIDPGTRLQAPPKNFSEIFGPMLATLRNPIFLPLIGSTLALSIARTIYAASGLYYFGYKLGFGQEAAVPRFMVPFFLTMAVSAPLWILVSKRVGKKRPATIAFFAWGTLTTCFYPFLPEGRAVLPTILAIIAGVLAGAIMVKNSMLVDLVDHDELKVGSNRRGSYVGVHALVAKLARALGLLIGGALLSWVGIEGQVTELSDTSKWRLGIMFGPGVGVFQFIGATLLALTPLSDDLHRRIQNLLMRKRRKRSQAMEAVVSKNSNNAIMPPSGGNS